MNFIQAVIFGIVEGITEFLPISSTAHLDFTRFFLSLPSTEFIKSFEIAIQLGAILAVVFLYWNKISRKYIKNILIAFIPTGIIGFLLYKIIKSFLIGNTLLASMMLIVGGIVIIFFEKKFHFKDNQKDDIEEFSIKELIILGLTQALAVVPGVSRSGAVIIAGRSINLSARSIAEFSFLLAVPTMLTATSYDLLKNGFVFSADNWVSLSIGFTVSFVVALFVVKWLIGYVKKHSFEIFGWYRILIGIIMILFIWKI